MVKWCGRITVGVLFLLVGVPGIGSQTQSAVVLGDTSDWWSMTRTHNDNDTDGRNVQHREIADTNFQIAGVDLHDITFAKVYWELGKTPSVQRGDASTWREQACYMSLSAEHPTYLIFERGEVNASFYLFSETVPWSGNSRCTRSDKILETVGTASGLHLGQTAEQVVGILGQPSERLQNELVYAVEVNRKTDADALTRARKQHPELTEEQFRQDYATYDLTVLIRAKFAHSKMVYLGVSTTESN